jgi:UDP-D-galactose:(glucosyl)LPS alpha-1,3-D-galactosyltransferase
MLPGRKELGMPEGSPYFNSGVMLMNLERWRADRLGERCLDLLAQYPHYFSHPDQDVLNYLARDAWLPLDPAWNVYAASVLDTIGRLEFGDGGRRRARLLDDESGARILHYAGPLKPWQAGFPPGGALDRYRAVENAVLPASGPRDDPGPKPNPRRSS